MKDKFFIFLIVNMIVGLTAIALIPSDFHLEGVSYYIFCACCVGYGIFLILFSLYDYRKLLRSKYNTK